MTENKARKFKIALPVLIIISLLIVADVLFWLELQYSVKAESNVKFSQQVTKEGSSLEHRFEVYSDTLYSLRGLFSLKQEISRKDWETYANSFNIFDRYPGITGIAYIKNVKPSEQEDFNRKLKDQYKPFLQEEDFSIYPAASKNEGYILTYIKPLETNIKSIGFDLASEPKRLKAVNESIETGLPTSTEILTLINEPDDIKSFIIYLPIYTPGIDVSTVEDRRNHLVGLISIAIKVESIMSNFTQPTEIGRDIALHIYDNKEVNNGSNKTTSLSKDNLIYSSGVSNFSEKPESKLFDKKLSLELANREWVLVFTADHNYGVNTNEKYIQRLLLTIGVILSLIISIGSLWGLSVYSNRVNGDGVVSNIPPNLAPQPIQPQPIPQQAIPQQAMPQQSMSQPSSVQQVNSPSTVGGI